LARELYLTRTFERLFKRLPKEIQDLAYEKLALFLEDPSHPSLRVKKMKGTAAIWEPSVTMNHRITFEVDGERVLLRRIGTHDVLREP
jgi:mRNA-degrading endonuclease YafQ of YafQ-DinJ toxin-antitoxin module